jgi:hypothetical protein
MSQTYGHQRAYCPSPGRYVSVESHGDDDDNSLLVHQSSLAVLPAETSGESRRNGRRSENFFLSVSYDMEPSALLPIRRKVYCEFYRP